MIGNSTQLTTQSGLLIKTFEVILPIIGGSLATLIGVTYRQYLREYENDLVGLYAPLFESTNELADGKFAFSEEMIEIESIWSDIDAHRKYNLSMYSINKLNEINDDIGEVEQFLRHVKDGISSECTYNNVLMSSGGTYPSICYKKRGGTTSAYSLDRWIKQYYVQILKASNADDLERKLKSHAQSKGEIYCNVFHGWDDRDFAQLYSAIENSEAKNIDCSDYESSGDLYAAIQNKSGEFSEQIEDVLKRDGFVGYMYLWLFSSL